MMYTQNFFKSQSPNRVCQNRERNMPWRSSPMA
jgi:hypothetical protein